MSAVAIQPRNATFVPVFGLRLVPEPRREDASPEDKLAESKLLDLMLEALQVPGPIAEAIKAAHEAVDIVEELAEPPAPPQATQTPTLVPSLRERNTLVPRFKPRAL